MIVAELLGFLEKTKEGKNFLKHMMKLIPLMAALTKAKKKGDLAEVENRRDKLHKAVSKMIGPETADLLTTSYSDALAMENRYKTVIESFYLENMASIDTHVAKCGRSGPLIKNLESVTFLMEDEEYGGVQLAPLYTADDGTMHELGLIKILLLLKTMQTGSAIDILQKEFLYDYDEISVQGITSYILQFI